MPSQPQRIISGRKINFSLSPSYMYLWILPNKFEGTSSCCRTSVSLSTDWCDSQNARCGVKFRKVNRLPSYQPPSPPSTKVLSHPSHLSPTTSLPTISPPFLLPRLPVPSLSSFFFVVRPIEDRQPCSSKRRGLEIGGQRPSGQWPIVWAPLSRDHCFVTNQSPNGKQP